jgi:hypothetical protein
MEQQKLMRLSWAVLRHILSFLPTKDAVRTSLLCKRWKYLSASTPNLDFERSLHAKGNHLRNFLERVFCLRDCCAMKHSLSIVMCYVMHLISYVDLCRCKA